MSQEKRSASDAELKALIKFLADSELLVSEVLQGFSFSEISQVVAIATDLPVVIQDASVFIPEWAGLSVDQQNDLVSYVQANCKYPANVVIEAYVQKVLSALAFVSQVYQVFAPAPVSK